MGINGAAPRRRFRALINFGSYPKGYVFPPGREPVGLYRERLLAKGFIESFEEKVVTPTPMIERPILTRKRPN